MQNLRALPSGYRTWCESGNLLLQSPTSARFRITGAVLCAGKPDGYVVCTADAEPAVGKPARKIPICAEIDAPRT